jgi:hypothetical protein
VRDALVAAVSAWLQAIARAVAQARQQGHLSPSADERQLAFEIHALILALHYEARFLQLPGATERAMQGFHDVLARHGAKEKHMTAADPATTQRPRAARARHNP